MKIFKFLTIGVVIILGISLFFPWSLTRSIYSKFIMDKDGILEKINFEVDCRYFKPRILLGSSNPQYQCLSYKYYDKKQQLEAIQNMEKILKDNGWTFSEKHNFHEYDVTYFKGDFKFNIAGGNLPKDDGTAKLFVGYVHMSQIDNRK